MENISKMVKDAKQIDYETLKKIQEHAKEYKSASDKKEFLKNVGAYEQKLILLDSINPYEVLCYLEELDLPTTKQILSELNYDEIVSILDLFTTEDKNKFYTTYSDLDLVNQFIVYDKRAPEHLEDLSVDRKLDLLNSSSLETLEATEKVYDSISYEDKKDVVSSLDSVSAMTALSHTDAYIEDSLNNFKDKSMEELMPVLDDTLDKKEEKLEEIEKLNQKELIQEEKVENTDIDPEFAEKLDYFKTNIDKYKETNPELNNIDLNDPQVFDLIGDIVKTALENDFKNFKNSSKEFEEVEGQHQTNQATLDISLTQQNIEAQNEQNISNNKLEQFEKARTQAERESIQNVLNQLAVSNAMNKVVTESVSKTL